jgi:hypothetical protein
MTQLTEDHSLINDYIRMKRVTPEEAENWPHKNVIVRALGMKESVQVDILTEKIHVGDTYLLCSDGQRCAAAGVAATGPCPCGCRSPVRSRRAAQYCLPGLPTRGECGPAGRAGRSVHRYALALRCVHAHTVRHHDRPLLLAIAAEERRPVGLLPEPH